MQAVFTFILTAGIVFLAAVVALFLFMYGFQIGLFMADVFDVRHPVSAIFGAFFGFVSIGAVMAGAAAVLEGPAKKDGGPFTGPD